MKISTNTYVGFHFHTRILIFSLLFTILLSACAPVATQPESATPTITQQPQEPTTEPAPALSDEEIDSYTATIHKYLPVAQTAEILERIPSARAILSGEPYDDTLSNQERQILAFAIVAELENQRGNQPLSFENEGVKYFFEPSDKNNNYGWKETDDDQEFNTLQIYTPFYRDKENNKVLYYWEGDWVTVQGSENVDYNHFVDQSNQSDGRIDFASENMKNFSELLNLEYVPMIIIDDTPDQLDYFPVKKGKLNNSGLVFYGRCDGLIINQDDHYALNVKLIIAGDIYVYYPNAQEGKTIKSVQSYVTNMEDILNSGKTYYIGLAPDHLTGMGLVYAEQIVSPLHNTDTLISNNTDFWKQLKNAGAISAYPIFIYDGN